MIWAILAILCAFIWATTNIIDKFVVTKWIRKPLAPLIVFSVIGFLSGIGVYVFQGFSHLSAINIFLAMLSGGLLIPILALYFKAVKIEEISKLVPFFYLSPVFTVVIAGLLLGEIFTPLKYLGIFLIVFGSIFISSGELKLKIGKAFLFMILSAFLLSITGILTKYVLGFADYWTIFGWDRIGSFMASLPLFYFFLPEIVFSVKKYGKKVVGFISASELLNLLATLLFTVALSSGFVTLATALTSTQAFFVLMLATLLTIFYPKIIREKVNRKILVVKLSAIVMMFAGVFLII